MRTISPTDFGRVPGDPFAGAVLVGQIAPEGTRRTRRLDRFWELFEEIATRRHGVHADRMVLHLLRFETETRELVALLDGAERAVYYNTAQMLLSVRFDKHGIDEGSEELHAWALTDPDSWLDLYDQRVCWSR